jgi:hypothetical protein
MKKVLLNLWHETQSRAGFLSVGLLAACLVTGCKTSISTSLPPAIQDFGPSYKPSNVFLRTKILPAEVKRVALLPLTITASTDLLESGVETLEPVIYAELEKTKRFEVIPVTRDQLKQWTGQTSWRSDEALPANLFTKIAEATGCNAVLFCQLTRYQPYQPLSIGWKFSLVQNPQNSEPNQDFNAQILWSVDEILDSGEPTVATGARQYYTQHVRNDAPSSDASTILSSPVRFGQYTLSTLLGTLPDRPGKLQ